MFTGTSLGILPIKAVGHALMLTSLDHSALLNPISEGHRKTEAVCSTSLDHLVFLSLSHKLNMWQGLVD